MKITEDLLREMGFFQRENDEGQTHWELPVIGRSRAFTIRKQMRGDESVWANYYLGRLEDIKDLIISICHDHFDDGYKRAQKDIRQALGI